MRNPLQEGSDGGQKKARNARELLDVLQNYKRTDSYEKHETGFLYTEGVKYLADQAGAYWLLDLIFTLARRPKPRHFGVWELTVARDHRALLVCEDQRGNRLHQHPLAFTDFPLETITLYLDEDILSLESEL